MGWGSPASAPLAPFALGRASSGAPRDMEQTRPTNSMPGRGPKSGERAADGVSSPPRGTLSANEFATRFQQGDAAVSLPDVMIAMQNSSLQFEAATQVRNRLVAAYQEIMNMQV